MTCDIDHPQEYPGLPDYLQARQYCNLQAFSVILVIMTDSLIQQLNDPQTWAITANNRLSRHWQQRFNTANQYRKAWPSATIMPLQALMHHWHQAVSSHLLLSPQQALALWQDCIPEKLANGQQKALSQATYQAWSLLQQWQSPVFTPNNTNQTVLLDWCQRYRDQLQDKAWIDPHQLPQHLLSLLPQSSHYLPKNIIWIGHHDTPPSIKALMESLAQHCCCNTFNHSLQLHTPKVVSCTNNDEEILTMARWAYNQPQDHSVGCVVTQLNQNHQQMRRVFDEVALTQNREPANFSLGPTLDASPCIQIALSLLSPNTGSAAFSDAQLPVATLSYWLLNPFILPNQEQSERLRLDLCLREAQSQSLPLDFVLTQGKTLCPKWCNALKQHWELWHTQAENMDYHHYVATVIQCLNDWQWPGEQLDESVALTCQHWLDMLYQTLIPLHLVQPSITIKQAYTQLVHWTQTMQAPTAPTNTLIQVLGILEARDLPFDALWVMGCDDQHWPTSASPSAFLPMDLQQQLGMPHASHAKEWEYCQALMQSFQQQPTLYSYAEWNDDLPQTISPLLLPLQPIDLTLPDWVSLYQSHQSDAALEDYPSDKIPAVSSSQQRGGTSLIEHQAQCPFKAFAMHRLHIAPYPETQDGLSPLLRGMLLHESMAHFWHKTKDQKNLLALDNNTLESRIHDSINQAITAAKETHALALTPTRILLEKSRLQHHLKQWLILEKQRPPFNVYAIEKPIRMPVGPLQLGMRIDRIDQSSSCEQYRGQYQGKNSQERVLDG